jgi:multidrug efflux system outer membrane protein
MRLLSSFPHAALALLPMVLSACQHAPEPAGQAETPARFAESSPSAPIWPEKSWWQGFGSPELDRLIAQAQDQAHGGSFDIQAAIARVRQADAQLRISGAPLLPSLTGDFSQKWQRGYVQGNRSTGPGGYQESRSSGLSASASYEVDVWGRVAATRDSALASALYSRFDQQSVALTAVAAIASTWFTALAYEDRLAVAERNLADSEEILGAIRGRLEVGTASALDVAQQEALAAGVRATLPNLRSNIATNLNALAVLVGSLPEDLHPKPGSLIGLSLPEVAPGLPSDLLRRRPDVASAEAQLQAANANIRAARAALYPQIDLTAGGGVQSAALATLFGPASLLANFAASATQTIFDNGALQAQVELDEGKREELVADYHKSVVQAFTDVENALTQYRYTTEQEKLQTRATVVAQRAADISRAQVLAGTSDIVTALQTQETLFADLDTLAQVRLARFQALVALYKALGGGWTVQDVIPPETHLFQGVL